MMLELARWGARFLVLPADPMRPDLARLGAEAFAHRGGPAPRGTLRLRLFDQTDEVTFRVRGTRSGAQVLDGDGPHDASLECAPLVFLGLASGGLPVAAAREGGAFQESGRAALVDQISEFFDLEPPPVEAPNPQPATKDA